MAKTYQEFLNEQFKPFVFKNFEVTEARSWDADKFISHHANVRSQQRFPKFTTATWQALIKYIITKLGDDFIKHKAPNPPPGTIGYRSFAVKFNHDGFEGWMTLRVRRHPANRIPRRYNLMAITVLGPDQPPLKKHNDIIRKLPATISPKSRIAEAVEVVEDELLEAEYQGKKVELDKPFRNSDGNSKFSVYVKNDKGNVVKVNFGDPDMEIKRDDPERRKSFRARHNCDDPGPKWKARYWSCYQWRADSKVEESLEEELKVPNANKGVRKRRFAMPQIEYKNISDFLSWAKKEYNLLSHSKNVDPKDYIPTQKDFNEDKVNAIAEKKLYLSKKIIVSGDGYILDGHHRWLGAAQNDDKIPAIILRAPYEECLAIMKYYPKSFTKRINEEGEPMKTLSDLSEELSAVVEGKKEEIRKSQLSHVKEDKTEDTTSATPTPRALKTFSETFGGEFSGFEDSMDIDELMERVGAENLFSLIFPELDRFLSRTLKNDNYRKAVKYYLALNKQDPKNPVRNLNTAARDTGLDPRALRKTISQMAAKAEIPSYLALESEINMYEDDDPCWDDYEMVGKKKKNGKEVPNCVPKEEEDDDV